MHLCAGGQERGTHLTVKHLGRQCAPLFHQCGGRAQLIVPPFGMHVCRLVHVDLTAQLGVARLQGANALPRCGDAELALSAVRSAADEGR